MSNQDSLDQEITASDFLKPGSDKIELLKSILESQYGREVSIDEAEEVGSQLVSLCEVLAHERKIVAGSNDISD